MFGNLKAVAKSLSNSPTWKDSQCTEIDHAVGVINNDCSMSSPQSSLILQPVTNIFLIKCIIHMGEYPNKNCFNLLTSWSFMILLW